MISGYVIGDKEVARKLRAIPDGIRGKLVDSVAGLSHKLQRLIKYGKLNGQVLNKRTGLLGRSIDKRIVTDMNSIVGIVSTNVEYAHIHEYGFEGTVTQHVKAHLRRTRAQMKASIKAGKGKATKYGKFGKSTGEIQVQAFTRSVHMRMPERSFMRTALAEMQNEIVAKIDRTVGEAIK